MRVDRNADRLASPRDVAAAGGRVLLAHWIAILVSHGRSPRSGNGYFGGVAPSMRSEGEWRVLTELGRSRI